MIILKAMKIIIVKLNYFYISSFRYTVWLLFVNKFHKCEKWIKIPDKNKIFRKTLNIKNVNIQKFKLIKWSFLNALLLYIAILV